MEAIDIYGDDDKVIEFQVEGDLLAAFDAEEVMGYERAVSERPKILYVFLCPYESEIHDRRVVICSSSREAAEAAYKFQEGEI